MLNNSKTSAHCRFHQFNPHTKPILNFLLPQSWTLSNILQITSTNLQILGCTESRRNSRRTRINKDYFSRFLIDVSNTKISSAMQIGWSSHRLNVQAHPTLTCGRASSPGCWFEICMAFNSTAGQGLGAAPCSAACIRGNEESEIVAPGIAFCIFASSWLSF